MIWRAAATFGATAPVVAGAAGIGGATNVNNPVVWHVLGYYFEAGSMIAAICACVAVRFYVVQHASGSASRWVLDVPVSALTLMFTAAFVIALRPEPLSALLIGTGLGAIGAGLIRIAKRHVDRFLGETTGA